MRINWFLVIFVIVTIVIASASFYKGYRDKEQAAVEAVPGRFEVVEEFKIFDGNHHDNGYIIQDRTTSECYIYLTGHYETAMTPTECKADE